MPWRQERAGKLVLTVKVKLVVLVTLPPVPVTVMVKVPVGVEVVVERVRVVEQVGEHAVGEKAALACGGSPEAEKETDRAVPEASVALMVLETEAPGATDLLPLFVREKLKVVGPGPL